jgi:hypothetical protein
VKPVQQQRAEAEHGGHHVVDLVGHPAGQVPDGVHPLSLEQALLRRLPLRHVDGSPRQILGPALGIPDHLTVVGEPPNGPVRPQHAELHVHLLAGPDRVTERGVHRVAIVRQDMLAKLLVTFDHLVVAQAEQARHAAVHPLSVARKMPAPDAHAGSAERHPEPLLAVAQPVLGLLLAGQVAEHLAEPDQPPVPVVHASRNAARPEAAAVPSDQPAVVGGAAFRRGRAELALVFAALAVLGGEQDLARPANEFRFVVSQEPPDPLVPGRVAPLGIQHEDGVVPHLLDQHAEAPVAHLARVGFARRICVGDHVVLVPGAFPLQDAMQRYPRQDRHGQRYSSHGEERPVERLVLRGPAGVREQPAEVEQRHETARQTRLPSTEGGRVHHGDEQEEGWCGYGEPRCRERGDQEREDERQPRPGLERPLADLRKLRLPWFRGHMGLGERVRAHGNA